MTPLSEGVRIHDQIITPDAFTPVQLAAAMYRLTADADAAALLLESCTPEEADALLNPGVDLIAEAVTAVKNRLDRSMSALVRVFSRHGSNVKPYDFPSIGPDRKNALFAYKTVTFTMDDGQTVSILFHSPGRDPMKLVADDLLIAYRWMLNRRDITAIVSPEGGRDINLQTMARRIMQLVEENSEKFQTNNEKRQEQAEALAKLESEQATENEAVDRLTQQNADLSEQIEDADERIARLRARLEAHGEADREGSGAGGNSPGATAFQGEPDGASFGLRGSLAAVRGGVGRTKILQGIASLFERFKEAGVKFPPSAEVFMALVDGGEQQGFSMNDLYTKLSGYEKDLADLQAGRIRGDKVVGRGNGGKPEAIKWLNQQIAQTHHALETHGIGASVNLGNFEGWLREQLQEAQSGNEGESAGSEGEAPELSPVERLEAEYAFASATSAFKESIAAYLDASRDDYNPLQGAIDATKLAESHGASVAWDYADSEYVGTITKAGETLATLDMGSDGKTAGYRPNGERVAYTHGNDAMTLMRTTATEVVDKLFNDPANGQVVNGDPAPEPEPEPESSSGADSQQNTPSEPDNLEALNTGLHRDILGSIRTIRGIDEGTEPGMTRSLFVSSISNKLKTQARNGNEDVVDAALLLLAQQSIEHGRPILAKRNAIWKVTGNDMDYYTEIAQRQASADAGDNTPTPAPEEQDATPTPNAEGSEPTETDRIGAALQALLSETDSTAAIDALETLMDEAEAAGIDIDNDPNMLAASDHVTALLEKESA